MNTVCLTLRLFDFLQQLLSASSLAGFSDFHLLLLWLCWSTKLLSNLSGKMAKIKTDVFNRSQYVYESNGVAMQSFFVSLERKTGYKNICSEFLTTICHTVSTFIWWHIDISSEKNRTRARFITVSVIFLVVICSSKESHFAEVNQGMKIDQMQ